MNRLDIHPISVTYPVPSPKEKENTRRLIVLVPADANFTALTQRIWELSSTLPGNILLISVCHDEAQVISLRRQLITMSAMLQTGNRCVDARVETGSNWIQAVRSEVQADDMIVCFAEQRAGVLNRPLSQLLQSNLRTPVYILSGLSPEYPPMTSWYSQIMAWAGSIGIIIGAFLLQIQITSSLQNWPQTVLLSLSVIGEIWLIGAWNRLWG